MHSKPIDAIIVPTKRDASYYYPAHYAVTLSDIIRAHTVIIRDKSITQARNQGLQIARTCGWNRILFLDDDIRIHDGQLLGAVTALRSVQVVAFTPRDFPDNSVVRHAARAAGTPTPVYPSGSAMLVNINKIPETRRFPEIYNEDWFFMHGLDVMNGGDVEQLPYNPFTPGRATHQELGDLIAEALRGEPVTDDKEFWDDAIRERKKLLNSIQVGGDMGECVKEASGLLDGIRMRDIRRVLRRWQARCT